MSLTKKLILNEERVKQIIRRIAYQIHENNMGLKNLTMVGICDEGFELAGRIAKELVSINNKTRIKQLRLDLDKKRPHDTINLNEDVKVLAGQSVILVDDVLNTGKTLTYCLMALLTADVTKIETAVLVDRGHPQFPVLATFSGYQLSTTLEDHIEVKLGKKPEVYLY
ncbi:MAG: phosphoribosyltransferase [Cytophagales bacterium]|nr:phosphoribosyltransferase [Cytophagales bacterium]